MHVWKNKEIRCVVQNISITGEWRKEKTGLRYSETVAWGSWKLTSVLRKEKRRMGIGTDRRGKRCRLNEGFVISTAVP